MSYVKIEINTPGVCIVTISRPQALNALNTATIDRLYEGMQEIGQNHDIKAVIITGEGEKAFVAGADIRELAELNEQEAFLLSKKGQDLFNLIGNFPKPVVAAVNGFALGGGCELAMACHMRIASANAKFGQPEINLGIIPGYGGTQRLTQLIGRGKAFELLMTGDMISAEEALALGLVNRVEPNREALMERAFQLMEKITSKSSLTLQYLIKTVNAGFSFENAGYDEEARNFGHCTTSQDFREGTSAFLEKRKPNFTGR